MLNFNEMNKKESAMYLISIGNHSVKMSEADTQTLINTILQMGYTFSETKSQAKSAPKPAKTLKESADDEAARKLAKKHNDNLKVVGKKFWQDDTCTVTVVDGEYRLYLTTPIRKVRTAIKLNAKEQYGAKWAGNYDTGDIYWTFPSKAKADAFKKARKEYGEERA